MIQLLGAMMAVILAGLALMHFIWAAGLVFPFRDERRLADAIVGRPRTERLPSRRAMALLGLLLLAAGGAALTMSFLSGQAAFVRYVMLPIGLFISAIFIIRAVVGILPAFERAAPVQPYLTLNRRLYSPLAGFLGIGFLLLTLSLADWSAHLARLAGA